MKAKAPKFQIGQLVQNKADGEVGEVVSFTFNPQDGYRYQVTSKEVDIAAKAIVKGYKIGLEDEWGVAPRNSQSAWSVNE